MSDATPAEPIAASDSARRQRSESAPERKEPVLARAQDDESAPVQAAARRRKPKEELVGEVKALQLGEEGRATQVLKPHIPEPEKSTRTLVDPERPLEGYKLSHGRYRADGKLAFVDRGVSIESFDETVKTARAIVALAEQKGWRGLDVSGSTEFQRQVYVESAARGLKVALSNYVPTQGDRTDAEARAKLHQTQRGNQVHELPVALRGNDVREAQRPAKETSLLLDAGKAPYGFRAGADESYFARLKGDDGRERVLWGKELEAALKRAEARPGDRVVVEKTGTEPVQVKGRRQGEDGVWQPTVIEAQRNRFNVEVVGTRAEDRTSPVAALERLLKERNVPQVTIDRTIKAFERAERLEAAKGVTLEARGYDVNAQRANPLPTVQVQSEHSKTRVR